SPWIAHTIAVRPALGVNSEVGLKKQAVVQAHFDAQGDLTAALAALVEAETLEEDETQDIRFVFDMYEAVGRWYPIVAAVFPDKATRGWMSIEDLARVQIEGDGTLNGWTNYVTSMLSPSQGKFPDDVPGRNTTEKIQVYATRLFDLFGGEATQNRFTADLQAHADAGSDADLQGAAQFLTEQSDFDLETGNI